MTQTHIRDFQGKNLYFIGIGGCSMSGLAQICQTLGYKVRGSDRTHSPFTDHLEKQGISVVFDQIPQNIHDIDLVIYSAAIKPEHPERAEAAKQNIPMLERSVLLGQISQQYPTSIAVSGCHGKTTITSMLALIFMQAKKDPTIHVGGVVDFLGGGVRVGKSDLFVTEACEYVESYLSLRPSCIILNNIDDDHLDYFRDIDHICDSFAHFLSLLPPEGTVLGNTDDFRVTRLLKECNRPVISYGLNSGDYQATNIKTHDDHTTTFEVIYHEKSLFEARLHVPGLHNVINALAAIVAALQYEVEPKDIIHALNDYKLTRRRFEFYGTVNHANVYHDYAHHPSEIAACLQGARSVCAGKLYVVFQCNSYTRAKTLFTEHVTCFKDADLVLVPDIFPGREIDTGLVHARDMVAAINQEGTKALYLPTFAEIRKYLADHAKQDDVIVTLGSGDVYIQTKALLD